ncbi:MAG: hypothetical protein A4E28_01964 [Methanocella sp. PtaU1.Bin125]|nr:MAG: hypothetical protein A4E28_01964 [Methanocella sp. PtaU1.Bin125]
MARASRKSCPTHTQKWTFVDSPGSSAGSVHPTVESTVPWATTLPSSWPSSASFQVPSLSPHSEMPVLNTSNTGRELWTKNRLRL